ncbi:tRNA(Ile)-lysidine synthase [Trinickia symbiotica]|uniref:tRNA(Ile)-lysidine synthase n=1 Tax=Trinickia symbiotica TaxID=863227 RepID=A0A2N7WL41_9BURK|nr:tRNA lysidine(34) synthetase TilS [Trinickia symbiotica]PMS30130.1 tRNA lysidine(34) synthetase TilS [Trinickia symbiotica]PPK42602.1 tRNA(Ile)-lysidine synthase [Trinickia symbiotica]
MISSTDSAAEHVIFDALGGLLSVMPSDARIAIAFSGGLDSSVLLDAAVRVAGAHRCIALHIHHGLSPNAERWLVHCEATARALGAGFDAERVDLRREMGMSIEAVAREARYRALDAMCARHGVAALWLAHHADDQAETVLLQLLRGAGVAGLAAMAPHRIDNVAAIPRVRPLLHLLRAQLERYARSRGLRWIEDESNADTRYARNALRHDVIPALTIHFPGFRDALARTAAHAATAQRLLDELAAIDLGTIARDDGRSLSREALLALDGARAMNAMRGWMRAAGIPVPSVARLTDMLRQLREARAEHALRIEHAGRCLRLYRDSVYWESDDRLSSPGAAAEKPVEHVIKEPTTLAWRGQEVWRLPQWRGSLVFVPVPPGEMPADTVAETLLESSPLTARPRMGGERMRRAPGAPARTLKNLFQESGVPAWQRDVPLVYLGDRLLFVPFLGINGAFAAPAADEERAAASGPRRRLEWRADMLIA